ncbi:sigma-70 family RNA polymerase sigma factor [uncultured Lactobacillus sp.]|uniref:sigma-70 family RNA polymerase sigma factor n=1 Tax=uncultured Lactobacillus sp. TaxID=153152 RepID=UPI0025E3E5BC|nr:sigma-70 family RNA polymerase sigma factor [uncultured Lactobacillus sp.]
MKINQQAFLTAWNNQKLVKGALKAAHVRVDYTNYEDLFQEGILIYAEMLTKFADKKRSEVDRLSFRKIIWHTIDLLRKRQRQSEEEIAFDSLTEELTTNWNNQLVLKGELVRMNEIEKLLYINHLIGGQTISSLAQEAHVSRVQLQRSKHNLLIHLREILEK